MGTKGFLGIVTVGICVVVALLISMACLHANNISQPIGKGMYSSGVMYSGGVMYSSGIMSNNMKREAQ